MARKPNQTLSNNNGEKLKKWLIACGKRAYVIDPKNSVVLSNPITLSSKN